MLLLLQCLATMHAGHSGCIYAFFPGCVCATSSACSSVGLLLPAVFAWTWQIADAQVLARAAESARAFV